MSTIGKNLGKVIKALREKKELSQLDLARKVGIDQSMLSLIESGKRGKRMNLDTLGKINKILCPGKLLSELIAMAETNCDL
ncbi:MAG: helix-turn-helix transcriptional regulator [Candidatus Falkowbacteria bacterium]